MTELKCPFCGTTHPNPDAYTDCVCSCRAKQRENEAIEKKRVLDEQRESRRLEVINAFESALKIQQKFLDDYPNSESRFEVHRALNWYWHF